MSIATTSAGSFEAWRGKGVAPTLYDPAASAFASKAIAVHLVFCVLTQKLAVPIGAGDAQIPFALVMQYLLFGIFFYVGILRVDLVRLLGLTMFAATAILVHAFYHMSEPFSIGSLFLLQVILVMYVFMVPLDRVGYERILKTFRNVGIAAGIMVFVNWGQQFAGIPLINLDEYIPTKLLYKNYAYMNKLRWDEPWIKPNGIVFLEVSHLSQFIAMALVIEATRYRNIPIIGFLALALLSSFGGTGTLLVLLAAPLILKDMPKKYLIAIVAVSPVILAVAGYAGVLDNFASRAGEFNQQKSSGFNRFVLPAITAVESLQRDGFQGVLGSGAGSIPTTDVSHGGYDGFAWSPYSKVIFEYGVPGLILWLGYTVLCIFNRGIPLVICAIAFIQYNLLNGALNVPLHTIYCWCLGAGYIITDGGGGRVDEPVPVHESRPSSNGSGHMRSR